MKKVTCVSLSKEMYHKIHVYCMIRKYFFDIKDASISQIVENALDEYFQNHKKETDEMIELYHKKGGCADI